MARSSSPARASVTVAACAPVAAQMPDARRRLLEAMAVCVAQHGYAATTTADLAAHARVSKRTFYEHFADKGDCLAALYAAAHAQTLASLREAVEPEGPWAEQLDRALAAYLGTLATHPALLHTLFIDIVALGPAGVAARREAARACAQFIAEIVAADRRRSRVLPPAVALAIVGGLHELVVEAIESGRATTLHKLSLPARQFVHATIGGLPRDPRRSPARASPPRGVRRRIDGRRAAA